MTIDPARSAGSSEFRGTTIYFCSKGCKAKFDAEPARFVDAAEPQAEASPASAWVCPMDADVRAQKPGACPRCGMALEPEHDDDTVLGWRGIHNSSLRTGDVAGAMVARSVDGAGALGRAPPGDSGRRPP